MLNEATATAYFKDWKQGEIASSRAKNSSLPALLKLRSCYILLCQSILKPMFETDNLLFLIGVSCSNSFLTDPRTRLRVGF